MAQEMHSHDRQRPPSVSPTRAPSRLTSMEVPNELSAPPINHKDISAFLLSHTPMFTVVLVLSARGDLQLFSSGLILVPAVVCLFVTCWRRPQLVPLVSLELVFFTSLVVSWTFFLQDPGSFDYLATLGLPLLTLVAACNAKPIRRRLKSLKQFRFLLLAELSIAFALVFCFGGTVYTNAHADDLVFTLLWTFGLSAGSIVVQERAIRFSFPVAMQWTGILYAVVWILVTRDLTYDPPVWTVIFYIFSIFITACELVDFHWLLRLITGRGKYQPIDDRSSIDGETELAPV